MRWQRGRQREEEEEWGSQVKMKGEIRITWSQPMEQWSHHQQEEVRDDLPLGTSVGLQAWWLGFGLLARNKVNFCSGKSCSLSPFVMVVENEHIAIFKLITLEVREVPWLLRATWVVLIHGEPCLNRYLLDSRTCSPSVKSPIDSIVRERQLS